jgi:high-affinity iron transporter
LVAIVTSTVVVGSALILINRDPDSHPVVTSHVAIAPGASQSERDALRVTGTTMSSQQAADAAVEDGVHPDLVPLPESAFKRPIARYRTYAAGQARAMGRAVAKLRQAADRGDRAGAERAWAESFDRWLLVGAAYGALGDLDTAITGSLSQLESRPASRAAAARLERATRRLPKAVRVAELAPIDYAVRAHEILEDVQRDDMGDPAGVRATADAVAATKTVIGTLRPVLAGRGDTLQQVDARLAQLTGTLDEIRRKHGEWPAPDALPRAERQELLGRLGATLETLAGVPAALETTLPPKLPAIR